MKKTMITTLVLVFIGMIYASIFGNFAAFNASIATEPWFQFMLLDFYVLALLLVAWMWKREKILWQKALWSFAFLLGGSASVLIYLLISYEKKK